MQKQIRIREVNSQHLKKEYVEEVWEILKEGYAKVKGGLHYRSKEDLIHKTDMWKVITYRGKCVAVTVYRKKQGIKLVALSVGREFKNIAISALRKVVKTDLKKCWMELSEAAEKFVMQLGGDKYIVPNNIAEIVLGKPIKLTSDGIHYVREIMGVPKEKVLVGTVKLT